MRNYMQAWVFISLMITFCVSCDENILSSRAPAKPLRFSNAGTITNWEGAVSGEVWGVSIEIAETSDGGIMSSFVGGISSSKGAVDAKQTIVAGDVTIEFAADGFEPIVLRVNSKDYGQIEEGDELSIDAERNVTINSELRFPL
ncbi:hypothetical protein OAF47_01985 [bacterium]|nr:hypothetical protein [bacterium]